MTKTLYLAWAMALITFGLAFSIAITTSRVNHATTSGIQALINAASDGGTISLPAGIYTESLTINKNITLTGVSSSTTFIQAMSGMRVITITAGHTVTLQNLSLVGGNASNDVGGGVTIDNGKLRIISCALLGNAAAYGGAIFQANTGRVDVIDSWIQGNSAQYSGGGLYINDTIALTATRVQANTSGLHGGGLHNNGGTTSITGGVFQNNTASQNGGGINLNNAVTIQATIIANNTAGGEGGGLLQWNAGQPVSITNSTFSGNHGRNGGGIWSAGNANIDETWFVHNTGRSAGGLWSQGNLTVTAGVFYSNTADTTSITGTNANGGGLYFIGGHLRIYDSLFQENRVRCKNCSFSQGGGLSIGQSAAAEVVDSTFYNNYGWFGGGLYSSNTSAVTVRHSVFQNNSAGYGGGLDASNATIQSTDFIGNDAVNSAGGAHIAYNSAITNARFIDNTIYADRGSALTLASCRDCPLTNIAVVSNTSYSSIDYGAISISSSSAHFRQVTFNSNRRFSGAFGIGMMLENSSRIIMTNTILANQFIGISTTTGTTTTLDGVLAYNTIPTGGSGLVNLPPVLTGNPAFTADGYHLTVTSAAVDNGVNSGVTFDIDGNPRPNGLKYDLGAVELQVRHIYLPRISRA